MSGGAVCLPSELLPSNAACQAMLVVLVLCNMLAQACNTLTRPLFDDRNVHMHELSCADWERTSPLMQEAGLKQHGSQTSIGVCIWQAECAEKVATVQVMPFIQ